MTLIESGHKSCTDVMDGQVEGPICSDCAQRLEGQLHSVVGIVEEIWADRSGEVRALIDPYPEDHEPK